MGRPPQLEPNAAQQAAEAERCFELKAQGKSLREIAGITGLSKDTVSRRIQQHVDAIISPRVADYRAMQDQQLDTMETHLLAQLDDPTVELDDKLKVMDRMLKLMDRRAKLHGVDAPQRVEGTVVHKTQQEAELEAMFAEIDAANQALQVQVEEAR